MIIFNFRILYPPKRQSSAIRLTRTLLLFFFYLFLHFLTDVVGICERLIETKTEKLFHNLQKKKSYDNLYTAYTAIHTQRLCNVAHHLK